MNNRVDVNQLLHSISGKPEEERTLSLLDLSVLGIGAMIGTGILVLTGVVAATDAGPGEVVSFLVAALASGLIGLCYAELSTTIPNSGSASVYAGVPMGQFVGFLAGWTLIGVYITTTATVANGWTGYFQSFLEEIGVNLPNALVTNPSGGGLVNLPALVMALLVTLVLTRGTGESKLLNNILVAVKIAIILLFIVVSARDVNVANWHPFFPYGASGVMTGAAAVFFSFLGFDALATSAEDAKHVQKNLPRAIIISLIVSTTLYVVVSLVMTGVVSYKKLNVSEAMASVLLAKGHTLTAALVSAGAILGIMAVVYAFVYAGANVTMAMSRGGLLPSALSKLSKGHQSPNRALWINGILAALLAGFVNLRNLALIANVGSLTVFALISLAVILLRRQHPDLNRPFKIPFGYLVPTLSILICLLLLGNITATAWLTYGAWLLAGVVFYFAYSRQKLM